ncbi:MAG: extracellular solute-binding protein [Gemmatimonadales bacterium]|nr:extracellular solute-binding protein [Gemmatimonadales bacterium]
MINEWHSELMRSLAASTGAAVRGMHLATCALMLLAGAACRKRGPQVVAYSSVDQVHAEPVFRVFEASSAIEVQPLFDTEETKSTGLVNRLIAEADHPQADVFWSGDPARVFLLVERGLVEPYVSPAATSIPETFKAADGSWTGVAGRVRVLLVNRNRVKPGEIPTSVRDLADPRWRGQTAIANPLFGTTTMHVAAWFAAWGDSAATAFLDTLRANDVRIASSNGEVKRLVTSGEVAFGLTDTDDANEAISGGANVAVVYPDQDSFGALVMPTVVVLVRGAPHPEAGRQLIDYIVSPDVERSLADRAGYMALGTPRTGLPSIRSVAAVRAMQVDYAKVADAMERIQPWLRGWVGLE